MNLIFLIFYDLKSKSRYISGLCRTDKRNEGSYCFMGATLENCWRCYMWCWQKHVITWKCFIPFGDRSSQTMASGMPLSFIAQYVCTRARTRARARSRTCTRMCVHIFIYTYIYLFCVFIFIYKYTYPLISDPNYRVKYRLILKNTYLHIQLQHTPGRQESWSSETLIMLLFRTKVKMYSIHILHTYRFFQQ